MDIRINFNGFTCWLEELNEYFKTIQWKNCNENTILYYSSDSYAAIYNFRIIAISMEDMKVELIAEHE